ncbi:electron transport complex subunit RsxB [Ectothiorhodospira marina]|uniref:Ion-translocating oxidoreductase complex subunit B n=1 Tax=Ectothiorhodospira marina TaxID=1396821 RepID=A0A1H7P3P9_9GAMM|nr:electron transport complex subunit RsxB [Ectothiorhodospira marina]SEL29717.1 electron transport complex protein RnfB [Ectothiorhodospira marina]
MLAAVLVISSLSAVFGLILGYSAVRFRVESDPVVDQIDDILPQTQCGQCGYPGCRPYAEAIAEGTADINLCPPGGNNTVLALADLLGRDAKPVEGDVKEKARAVIDENTCIGCTLCLQACPVDAIVGAPKQLHTVIGPQCTGCELCINPCPVDCIRMEPIPKDLSSWKWPLPLERPDGRIRLADLAQQSASGV